MAAASWIWRLARHFGVQRGYDPADVAIAHYRLTPPGWPDSLNLRIVMLSDIHACEPWLGAEALENSVARANALNPDLVLLLGDYQEGPRGGSAVPADVWARILAQLQAPLGIHGVLGNHDYPLKGRRRLAVERPEPLGALIATGIGVLINRAIRLSWQGQSFWLAGLGDQVAEFSDGRRLADLPGTLAQVDDEAPILLLAHEPDIFPQVPQRVALTLSGHLHGGQIRPFGYAPIVPSRFGQRYLHGHIIEDDRHLIVGAGLGYSGLPLRLGAPPEIVLIELGKGQP